MTISLNSTVEVFREFGREVVLLLPGSGNMSSQYFVWNSRDYENGKNTILPISPKNVRQYFPHMRWKGNHTVRRYCGSKVKFILDSEWAPPSE